MRLRHSLTCVAGGWNLGREARQRGGFFTFFISLHLLHLHLSSPSFSPFLSSVLFSPSLNSCHRPALGQVLGIQRTKPALFFHSLPPCLFLSFLHQTEITLAGASSLGQALLPSLRLPHRLLHPTSPPPPSTRASCSAPPPPPPHLLGPGLVLPSLTLPGSSCPGQTLLDACR